MNKEINTEQSLSSLYKVGDNIQRALDKRNMTQVTLTEELTKMANKKGENKTYSKTHINKWCNNRNVPTISNLKRIASIVGYSLKELATGKFNDEPERDIKIYMDDPVIRNEINQTLEYVGEACREKDMGKEKVKRYQSLIEDKLSTIIKYIMG